MRGNIWEVFFCFVLEEISAKIFLYWKVLNYKFNFFNGYEYLSCLFLVWILLVCVILCQIPLMYLRSTGMFPFAIDILKLYLSFLGQSRRSSLINFIELFRNHFLVTLFFPVFLISILLISAFIYLISLACFVLSLLFFFYFLMAEAYIIDLGMFFSHISI